MLGLERRRSDHLHARQLQAGQPRRPETRLNVPTNSGSEGSHGRPGSTPHASFPGTGNRKCSLRGGSD